MKNILVVLFLTICYSLAAQTSGFQSLPMTVVFTIEENDLIPEGIAYDPVNKEFFVSSTYKRKIIRIKSDGSYEDFISPQQDNIKGVLGLRIDSDNRVLWAVSSDIGKYMPIRNSDSTQIGQSFLHKYDLNTGVLIRKYSLNQSGTNYFLNDLVLDQEGIPYITETMGQKIYTINSKTDEIEVFIDLPKGFYPNGIDISECGEYAFVAMYAESKPQYGRIHLETREFILINLPDDIEAGADGLYFFRNSLIGIIPGLGKGNDRIIQYFLDGSLTNVIDYKIHIDNHKLLSQPTTGVIVDNNFYFIANSNLQLFSGLYRDNNGEVALDDLTPVIIGVFSLN